jgi:hypothetical protein
VLNDQQSSAKLIFAATLCFIFLTGCSVQQHLLLKAGDLLSTESTSDDDDLEMLMHASAYHLKLSESLLQDIPEHSKLAESVARGYTQYAFVFLMDEADRIESENLKKAMTLRSRAAKMLSRAKSIGLQSLRRQYPQLEEFLQGKSTQNPPNISATHAGLAYWTMTAWAGAISMSKDSPEAVADLPAVLRLAELGWHANPKYDHGSMASMMGTLELARPGGKSDLAEKYFDLAIQWRGDQIGPLVSKAENWAVAQQNKDEFTKLLNQAISQSDKLKDLTNTVMGRRARWLLETVDNYF